MRNPPLSMMSATLASDFTRSSCRARPSSWTSSSMSWGSEGILGGFTIAVVDEFVEQDARDHVERLEDTLAFVGARREGRHFHLPIVEQEIHVFGRSHVRQIA